MKLHRTEDGSYHLPIVVGSLILGVFFGGVGGGVAFPTLPLLGEILYISPFVVGVILSANRVTRLVMNTPAGQVIDNIGTKRPMVGGLFLQAIAPFGYIAGLHAGGFPFVNPETVFIASRIVWGFGSAFVFVGAFSTIIHVTAQHNRGKWIGYFRGGQSLGFPSGLVLGGILTDFYGFEIAFATAGVSGLIATVVAALVLPNVAGGVKQPAKLRELPQLVQADTRILAIGIVNFVVRFLYAGILLSTIVLYAQTHGIGFGAFESVGVSGIIMALSVVSASVMTIIAGRLSDRVSNRALIPIPAMTIFAVGFILLAIQPTLVVTLFGVALIGIGVGGTNPPLLAFLGDISPDADVGKMGGVYNVFGDIGSSLGPVVALPLAAAIGYRMEYALSAGLALLTVALVLRTLITAENTPTSPAPAPGDD